MQAASDPAFDAVALSELHSRAWTLLEEGVRSARSPFHTPAMATQGASGPSVRTVVLRHADPEKQQISCHTDWRSAKRRELQKDGRVSWLFYDRDRKLQLRLAGQAQVHNGDALASERWRVSSINSRRCYSTESPPGTFLDAPAGAATNPNTGWHHFTVIVCTVARIDWLFLSANGHQRALLAREGDTWIARWVAP